MEGILKKFQLQKLLSIAHPMQKHSLISTVPLFSKSDKKWRRYCKKCDFGIVMRENGQPNAQTSGYWKRPEIVDVS